MVDISFVRMPSCGNLPMPSKATPNASGYDLQAAYDAILYPGLWVKIDTGWGVDLPEGYEAQVRPRSGLAAKHAVTVLNAPGTIDNDYKGSIQVILINLSGKAYGVARGDRIAQLVLAPVVPSMAKEASAFKAETQRGDGGFGSTGV